MAGYLQKFTADSHSDSILKISYGHESKVV